MKKESLLVITKEINDETAIRVSPRWYLEVGLSIGWVKALYSGGSQGASIRIRIAKVENRRKIKVHGFGER